MSEIHEWVLEAVDDWIDGDRNEPRGPFCSKYHLRERAQSSDISYTPNQVENAARTLIGEGELLDWGGLLVTTSRERLVDVIEYEKDEAEITRRLLIAKCNKYLKGEIGAYV